MLKKVNEKFISIRSKYVLQCICSEQNDEIERLNNIINELDHIFYESFRINQNGSYTITETDYKEIEYKLHELKGDDN